MSTPHIRIDTRSKEFLRQLAERNDRNMAETARDIFAVFSEFVDEIDGGSDVYIERRDGSRVRYCLPVIKVTGQALLSTQAERADTESPA